jgi:O-antigen ligase
LVAHTYSVVINQATFLLEVLLVLEYVTSVSERDKTLRFFYIVFAIVAILYTVSMLLGGVTHGRSGRLYLSDNSNPNSDGIILAFGVYSTLKMIDFKKLGNLVPLFAVSVAEFYGIFLTGSRKALILAALFFAFNLIKIWNKRNELSRKAKSFLVVILVAAVVFAAYWMVPVYMRSSAFLRMQRADISMLDRWDIAYDAIKVFLQHPFFGVGLNNYKFYSSLHIYSHSTIPELLAGTGIFGTVLFCVPYFYVIDSLLKKRMASAYRMELWWLLVSIMTVSTVMIIPNGMPLSFFSIILFLETTLAENRVRRKRKRKRGSHGSVSSLQKRNKKRGFVPWKKGFRRKRV